MSHSNAGRWPVGEAWVYDGLGNYIGTMTYYDPEEMSRSVSYLNGQGYMACPRKINQAKGVIDETL
jgi:hypothetical protein